MVNSFINYLKTYLPVFPVKEPSLPKGPLDGASSERERSPIPRAPFSLLPKSPEDEPSSSFPKNGAPMERDARLQSLFYISFRVPSKEALPPGSLHRAPMERYTTPPEPLHPFLKVPVRWTHSRLPNRAPIKRDAHPQSLPFILCQQLHRFPKRASEERDARLQNLLYLSLKVPGKCPPPPCPPSGSLWREKPHLQGQLLIHLFIYCGVPNKEPSHKGVRY